MKKRLLLISAILMSTVASAQYYQIPFPDAGMNPGGLNTDSEFPFNAGTPNGWSVVLPGANTSVTWSAPQTIAFPFNFNGAPETQFKVSSSGVLTFDIAATQVPAYAAVTLPNANVPAKSVAILGLNGIGANDVIITKTFGVAPNRQQYIHFTSYGYGTVTSTGSDYTYWSIVLEETTNKIYIVDQRTGGYTGTSNTSMGIQIDGSTAVQVAGAPATPNVTGFDATPADNGYYAFFPGVQPAFDINMASITTSPYLGAGNNTISGTLNNFGTTTITSMTLNYRIDAGATISAPITGLNIPSLGNYSFSHPTPWNATAGDYVVEVWATALNGSNPDGNPSNDFKTKNVSVLSELVQRIPLLEVFTSSTCGPCTPGNVNFHNIMDTIPRNQYVAVKYQQNFPGTGDPYSTAETVARRTVQYAINSIPRMEIDGLWDQNASSYSYPLFVAAKQTPAFYKMEGSFTQSSTNLIGMKVRFAPLVTATNARLHIAIVEEKTDNNVKSNGETEFFDVLKKMVPTQAGTVLPTGTINVWDSLSFTYQFNGNYRLPTDGQAANNINLATEHSVEEFTDLEVYAWVQGDDKVVFQACNLTALSSLSIADLGLAVKGVNVFPNPSNDNFAVTYSTDQSAKVKFVLVDMTGSVVYSKNVQTTSGQNEMNISTSDLANGIYSLMIFDAGQNAHVEKVVVQH